jgi:argininosuccinate synthase
MKSRGIYENPAGSILYAAHQAVETLTLDRETYHYKQQIALKYADLVYNGQWFSTIRESLDAFVDKTQEHVTGTVRIKLYKGNIILAGVKSPYSLYSEELATFEEDAIYDQKDANGFIRLFGLPLKVNAMLRKR